MRYQHIVEAVYGRPWAMKMESWYAVHQIVLNKVLTGREVAEFKVPEGKRPMRDIWGEALDQMDFRNGIARIPVKGALVHKAGMIDKMCGAVSHQDVQDDLGKALDSKELRGIILDFDSPGGMISGTPELGRLVAEAAQKVPIYGFTDSLRASAAEWIGAGCTKLFATESAWVGSIGVIWEVRNVARALEASGIDWKVFASGDLKGVGHPYVPMDDQAEAWFENEVNQEATIFRGWMKAHRPQIDDEYLQGQPVKGREAFKGGLIDAVVRDIEEVYGLF